MKRILSLALLIFLSTHLIAQEGKKEKLATEYFLLFTMDEIWKGMVEEVTKAMPEEGKAHLVDMMNNHVNVNLLESEVKKSLIKHLNEKELEASIRLMKDPHVKSALIKMKYCMADLMPIIEKEMMRVFPLID